jgi:hypothetical protein
VPRLVQQEEIVRLRFQRGQLLRDWELPVLYSVNGVLYLFSHHHRWLGIVWLVGAASFASDKVLPDYIRETRAYNISRISVGLAALAFAIAYISISR